ncbi:MAG TPA: Hsp20/alpha crystallin family protein [Candidatus Eisenbergiella merdavium]|uniref:Hsp20/alpha crystallin family protein n=1 Tax=Candidatus Eisenbergiella merdavium TaxID=2838551 RepID=A0A9D2NDG0_9FIRM|nr:Hsp20/alpha crystallin family protein [Candidatus Eisenbergiella merdavium]
MLIRNNLFDDFFGDMFDDPFFNRGYVPQNQLMKTDIREKDGQYLLEIEVPGYTREDVKAELKDGYLTITADRKDPVEKADERTRYVRKERYYGTMKRTFYVGEDITENEIHAAFKDGILKVIIDKPQPKKIEDEKTIIPIEG